MRIPYPRPCWRAGWDLPQDSGQGASSGSCPRPHCAAQRAIVITGGRNQSPQAWRFLFGAQYVCQFWHCAGRLHRGNIAGANFIQLFTAVCKRGARCGPRGQSGPAGEFFRLWPSLIVPKHKRPDKGRLAAVFHDDLENQGDRIGCGIIPQLPRCGRHPSSPSAGLASAGDGKKRRRFRQQGLNARIARGREPQ